MSTSAQDILTPDMHERAITLMGEWSEPSPWEELATLRCHLDAVRDRRSDIRDYRPRSANGGAVKCERTTETINETYDEQRAIEDRITQMVQSYADLRAYMKMAHPAAWSRMPPVPIDGRVADAHQSPIVVQGLVGPILALLADRNAGGPSGGEEIASADGPGDRMTFRWRGMSVVLSSLRHRLCEALWDKVSGRPVAERNQCDVLDDLYPDDSHPEAKLKDVVKQTNTAFERAGIALVVRLTCGKAWIEELPAASL